MSRLDDELRNAFRREQAPFGFTERVLERIAQQPAPRPSWWRRLAMLLEPPRLRWVAIGMTASLLLAIGAAQYGKLGRITIEENDKTTAAAESSSAESKSVVTPGGDVAQKVVKVSTPKSPANPKRNAALRRQLALARLQKEQEEQELRAQAEAAKEKLMLALHIASNALNDAQKAVHDDGPKP